MRTMSKNNALSVALVALALVALNVDAHNISGVWWDPDQGGTGVTLWQEGEQVSGAWYFYGENGRDVWFTFVGTSSNDRISVDLLRFTGPALGDLFDPSQVQSTLIGKATFTIRAPGAIDFNYSITREGDAPANGMLNLVPFSMTVLDTERLADFAGFYTGRFRDDDGIFGQRNGVFAASADNFGNFTGVVVFGFTATPCSLAGTFTANGEATLAVTVSPGGAVSGSWVSDTGASSGTFSGSRQD